MSDLWRWFVGVLVWLSADPQVVEREQPRSAAAVMAARASMEPDRPAKPKREDAAPPQRCTACDGKGYTVKAGTRYLCPACKGCPDGSCPQRQ